MHNSGIPVRRSTTPLTTSTRPPAAPAWAPMSSSAQPREPFDTPRNEMELTHQLAARLPLGKLRRLREAAEALALPLQLAGRPVHMHAAALPLLDVLGALCEVRAEAGLGASGSRVLLQIERREAQELSARLATLLSCVNAEQLRFDTAFAGLLTVAGKPASELSAAELSTLRPASFADVVYRPW